MSFDNSVVLAFDKLKANSMFLITAESLTAGLIASRFGEIPGASDVFWGGFIAYTPKSKDVELGVSDLMLSRFGIVSEQVARAMAYGALCKSGLEKNAVALSVTGYAGPTGGTSDVPIGTVCVGIAHRCIQNAVFTDSKTFYFRGSRNEIREQTVEAAVDVLVGIIDSYSPIDKNTIKGYT